MDYIWTPWRYKYISKAETHSGCVFCSVVKEEDEKNYVLHRAQKNFIILNLFPYTSGHAMVVPYEHCSSLVELDSETTNEMMELAKSLQSALQKEYRPNGINIGINQGEAAGAGIAQHLHLHVLPRWIGDANFMSVIGETRVMPEEISTTCERLRKYF
jgi:ATP adenylyltransferase